MLKYDYLVVGCGLFGAVFGREMAGRGKSVLIIDKRKHIGGNCYSEEVAGIMVHKYGPHIFHTDSSRAWEFVNQFSEFNSFINRPKVRYRDKLYSFPINLMTLQQLWGVTTPQEAALKLQQAVVPRDDITNLADWAISQVGEEIYRIFIEGHTRKQWGRDPRSLPSDIIKRIPIRLDYNDNYYNDRYQGIPAHGYTRLFERLLEGIDVVLSIDYLDDKDYWDSIASRTLFTGRIDEYFGYAHGELEYRSLRFEEQVLSGDYQGNAVVNYTEYCVPFTRITEHKHFVADKGNTTVITREFPAQCSRDGLPCYPVHTPRNKALYDRYRKLATTETNVLFGGRLASYRYLDMDETVLAALDAADHADQSAAKRELPSRVFCG